MNRIRRFSLTLIVAVLPVTIACAQLNVPPEGFTALFNGKDLEGWWGLGTEHYKKYVNLSPEEFKARQEKSRENIRQHWRVEDGVLVNDGRGLYLSTDKFYGDFELMVDYKTVPRADSGIYLRGCPQVQIWDSTEEKKFKIGADKGSGGLWNNAKGAPGKDPLVKADKPFGEWNSFHIKMVGDYVTIKLNRQLVVDNAKLHNYFDRKVPVPRTGPIQLQTHGGEIRWRNVFLREIGPEEANEYLRKLHTGEGGYDPIFNGENLEGWAGPVDKVQVADGAMTPNKGTLFTKAEYGDFTVMFDFFLPPGGNNGLAIRHPGKGNPAYDAMCELQVLENNHPKFAKLKPHQYHASAYGMVPALRGYEREPNQWNFQKVTVKGSSIKAEVNGFVILDTDLAKVDPKTFMYPEARFKGRTRTSGHFGFAGHGDPVKFRNVVLKKLD